MGFGSSYIQGYLDHFPALALKIFPWKNFLYFFLKKSTPKVLIFLEMEFSGSKIKNFLIFSQKSFSYISGNGTSYILGGNFPSSKSKKTHSEFLFFLYFKKLKRFFLYFGKWNFPTLVLKSFFYFLKKNFSYILGNETLWKISYISGGNFLSSKNKKEPTLKKYLKFREMELSSYMIRDFLIFQEGTCKTWKTNKKICSEEISRLLWHPCNLYSSKA